jgi:alanine-alpha-ketoisovalerate/valine-pyruvate aminotransferase
MTRQVNSLDASLRSIREYALSQKFMGSLENELIHKSDIIRMVDEALNPFFSDEEQDVENISESHSEESLL